jgi:flagellin
MRIQHNIMAMNAYRNYNNNTSSLSGNLEKLSSGYKINRAGDDAAGLAISEKMRAQISGLEQASSNVKDGISLVKTGEGALQEVQDMLNRMVTLATQSANGTYDDDVDRANLQSEVTALKSEINRIADSANFNGINLLDGSLGGWKGATIAAATGFATNPLTVMGGSLKNGDGISLTLSSTGTISFTSAKIGGVSLASSGALASKGLTFETISKPSAGTAGTAKYKITVTDKTKATTDLADAIGDGITVNFTVTGKGAATNGSKAAFTTTGEGGGLQLQIGDTAKSYNQMKVGIGDMHTKNLGIDDIDISGQEGASTAIDKIKAAINSVSSTRGDLGAVQNRLEHTQNNLSVMTENIQDAESTIRDTDVAEEMMAYTKNNILVQSAQAMLAQANSVPQGVLQLLQ